MEDLIFAQIPLIPFVDSIGTVIGRFILPGGGQTLEHYLPVVARCLRILLARLNAMGSPRQAFPCVTDCIVR